MEVGKGLPLALDSDELASQPLRCVWPRGCGMSYDVHSTFFLLSVSSLVPLPLGVWHRVSSEFRQACFQFFSLLLTGFVTLHKLLDLSDPCFGFEIGNICVVVMC